MIHGHFLSARIQDYHETMKDVHACLKPGGIALWIDIDYDLYQGMDFKYLQVGSDKNPSGSWCGRFLYGMCTYQDYCSPPDEKTELQRIPGRGGNSHIKFMAESIDEGMWDDPLIDPET